MKTASIEEHHDASQDAVIHEKGRDNLPPFILFPSEKEIGRKQVERHAAELEREIPDVVKAVVHGQQDLFRSFDEPEGNSQDDDQDVISLHGTIVRRSAFFVLCFKNRI